MQKNKLNLHICGIHLLNPDKTVVSHLNIVTTVTLLLTLLLYYPLSLIVKHLFNLRASVCVVLALFLLFLMLSLESLFSPLSNTR